MMPDTSLMVHSTNSVATVLKFIACINAHDSHGIVALCSDDHVFVDSLGGKVSGRDQLEQGWKWYFAVFPDYRIEIGSILSEGCVVLACGFASATHAPSKTPWRIPAAWRARTSGSCLGEWQVFADNKPVYELLSKNA